MDTRKNVCSACLKVVVLLVGVVSAIGVEAQVSNGPFSEKDLMQLLTGGVSPKRVMALVQERKIDFQLDDVKELEFRRAGATDSLILTLKGIQPQPPALGPSPVPIPYEPTLNAVKALTAGDLPALEQRAKAGDAIAETVLGTLYMYGFVFPTDYTKAVSWLQKGAEAGNSYAQFRLAAAYLEGLGTQKDLAEGLKWERKAAEQENPYAQFNFGKMYHDGLGIPKDEGEALKWWSRCVPKLIELAEKGDMAAQRTMGMAYSSGLGVIKDETLGFKWSRMSAEQG